MFPRYFSGEFAEHQQDFWKWVWDISPGVRPPPRVNIWPRGGAKSTSAEGAAVAVGARKTRRYVLYVSETQEQADDHVATIGGMLESDAIEEYYPDLGKPLLSKYGNAKGWRRNRLRAASGFTIDAIGLDSAARGVKLDEDRPDFIIFDDIDSESDTPTATDKKIKSITRKLLPAGSTDVGVLAIQNKVFEDSIFSMLSDGRADFLVDRIVSGPIPAIRDLQWEQYEDEYHNGPNKIKYRITAGTASWSGQNIDVCTDQMNSWGISAFLAEAQHEVDILLGGLFDNVVFRHCRLEDVPDLIRTTVWCDPAVTNTDRSDSQGVNADGIAYDGTIYRLYSWEGRTSPDDALRRAILKAIDIGALHVGVETDQGGDTWLSVYDRAINAMLDDGTIRPGDYIPEFVSAKAGAGHGPKTHRASKMLPDYERGEIVHVISPMNPTHQRLERALRRFPKKKPFDLVDASFWSWADLRNMLNINTTQEFAFGQETPSAYSRYF
jgi:hypothetical protein